MSLKGRVKAIEKKSESQDGLFLVVYSDDYTGFLEPFGYRWSDVPPPTPDQKRFILNVSGKPLPGESDDSGPIQTRGH